MEKKMKKDPGAQYYPVALTIAGSDSGGGAGIQADLRTFNALGVFGTCAVTAVTSQNPFGVSRIDPVPAEGVASQIEAVCSKMAVKAAKTGMLFAPETVEAVSAAVEKFHLKVICDPVMVSTSGSRLLVEPAVEAMKKLLLPKAAWITPNLPEAELLLGKKLDDPAKFADGAKELFDRFGACVLLKGGHSSGKNQAVDYVCCKGKVLKMSSPVLNLPKLTSHGTGCTLSSAMAALTALEFEWEAMLTEAKAFVFGSLRENVPVGAGLLAMYPPAEDSLDLIRLEPVKK